MRQGDKVRTLYYGAGEAGLLIAQLTQLEVEAERRKREAERAWRREQDERSRPVIEWSSKVERAVRAALEGAGFHRHKRGEWRRRKMVATMTNEIQPAPAAPAAPAKRAPAPLTPEVRDIERRYRADHKKITRREAKALLDARPGMIEANALSPAVSLLASLLSVYDKNEVKWEGMRRKFFEVRDDLAGPSPTPTESLLAERAALCWLDLNIYEGLAVTIEMGPGPATLAQLAYSQKRVDAGHRRFLSAVRTLAVVRKLQVPDLQVNIDGRSVHFGGPAQPLSAIDVTP